MPTLDEPRIRALISLLSDDNARVVTETRRALFSLGDLALPYLLEAAEGPDAKLRVRARLAHEELRAHLLEKQLRRLRPRLCGNRSTALEEGCILLARSRFADLEVQSVKAALDAMADDLGSRLENIREPREAAQVMSRFLGSELGFRGNRRNYYDPDNSYVNRVLERRTGIPISLSVVYLFVGRRLGLPLHGIGLPGHFILRYGEESDGVFLDPFTEGRLLSEADCRKYLEESQFIFDRSALRPAVDDQILLRIIRNLEVIYRNRSEEHRLRLLGRLRQVLSSRKERESQGDAEDSGFTT